MSLDALRKHGLNVGHVAVGVSGLDDVRQTRSRLKALEDAEITMLWTGEIFGAEAFTCAQRLLHASEKLVIASGSFGHSSVSQKTPLRRSGPSSSNIRIAT